ncbi:endospore germination permease [Bacillaceae bacterium SIJ1]|uniref:GerAB/ArcD/ProY family transporter n=1 Tax=Litoribacterium kuwaitense TaxID=1398745 RepID=UPI0013ECD9A6|nr:endospore germination permease [Litoribacterium kuwaitense]NGP45077.1 endospore germination permease [Litoribacterium kuwaitense]
MSRITMPQLFAIFLLSTGLNNHVIVIPVLIRAAGRDAWISILIGYALILILSPLFLYVLRQFRDQSLFDWLSENYSDRISKLMAALISIFLFIAGWITLKETILWTNETYLFYTPMVVIALLILASSLYISFGKLNIIAICAGILLPLVVLFGVFVALGTIPDKQYQLVAPVLVENDWFDVFHGAVYSFGSIMELLFLVLLQHQVVQQIKFKHFIALLIFLMILTVGPLIGTIAIFGVDEAANLRYPAFFQWRIVGIGNYFNHLDFLSIYQWLSGIFIRLALILYLITHSFKVTDTKKRFRIQLTIAIVYLLSIMAQISDEQFLSFLSRYYYLGSGIFGISFVLLLFVFIKIPKRGENTNGKNN